MPKKQGVNAIQHGGTHYKSAAIEPWDYIVANNLNFLEGSVVKYITRWRSKGGVEDLKKIKHYVDKLIEVETKKAEPNDTKRASRNRSESKPAKPLTGATTEQDQHGDRPKQAIKTSPAQTSSYRPQLGKSTSKRKQKKSAKAVPSLRPIEPQIFYCRCLRQVIRVSKARCQWRGDR